MSIEIPPCLPHLPIPYSLNSPLSSLEVAPTPIKTLSTPPAIGNSYLHSCLGSNLANLVTGPRTLPGQVCLRPKEKFFNDLWNYFTTYLRRSCLDLHPELMVPLPCVEFNETGGRKRHFGFGLDTFAVELFNLLRELRRADGSVCAS